MIAYVGLFIAGFIVGVFVEKANTGVATLVKTDAEKVVTDVKNEAKKI